jgi:predicted PurR-regulated permease PerM
MIKDKSVQQWFLIAIIVALLVLAFLIIRPIAISIIFGLLFAYIFLPVYRRINRRLKRPNLSAFIMIILIGFAIAVPIVLFTPAVVQQTFETYTMLQQINFGEHLQKAFPSFFNDEIARSFSVNLNNLIGKTFTSFLNQFTTIIVNIPNLILQFAVFLFTFFFSVRDSKKLKNYISELSPFTKTTEAKFSQEFRGITNAIIFGQVLIGVIQGLVLGIALFALGVPNALTLTLLASAVSIIPVLGSWLVWLPVGILSLILGNTFTGIFILLYGAFFVSVIDNILRPYFLSKRSNLPIALSIIGIIGGLYLFGIAGLVLGPLILAYVLIIIEFYKQGKLDELFGR